MAIRLPFLLLALLGQALGASDLVVIVNPASGVERLSREETIALFMGRSRKLPSGLTALAVDLGPTSPQKAAFYATLVNKDVADIHAYWARLLFSGQASPPRQALSEAEVLDIVRHNKGAIGYVERRSVDRRVKIVLDLSR